MSKRQECEKENQEAEDEEEASPNKRAKMSRYDVTPAKKMGEKAFKTPMTFSPRINGEMGRPSPSRVELWKEELGLNDINLAAEDDTSSNSDQEPEVDQNTKQTCTLVEYSALVKELAERESQRDELRYRCKLLLDKNKSYRTKLEKDEASKKQQLKIVTRTHQLAMQEKERLIKTLEDLTVEQEGRIAELEASIKGETVPLPADPEDRVFSGVKALKDYVQTLQQEKSDLLYKVMMLEDELQEAKVNTKQSSDAQDGKMKELEIENKQLKEETTHLRTQSRKINQNDESKVCELELENDRLLREMRNLKSQVEEGGKSLKLQQDGNSNLTTTISQLEDKIKEMSAESEEREKNLQGQLESSKTEHQQLEEKFRNTLNLLEALQAKSPEVVTKVEKVEIESEESKRTIVELREEIEKLKNELKESCESLESAKKEQVQTKEELEKELNTLKEQETTLKQNVQSLQEECTSLKEQLQTTKDQCSTAENQHTGVKQELDAALEQHKSLEEQISQLTQQHSEEVEKLSAESAERMTQLEKEKMLEMLQMEDQKTNEMEMLKERMEAAAEERTEQLRESERQAVAKMTHMQQNYRALVMSLKDVKAEAHRLKEEHRSLREHCHNLPNAINNEARKTTSQVVKAIADIHTYNQELATKYRKEMQLRKKYHNELVELKGNIRVFCRLRPPIKEDGSGPAAEIVTRIDYDDDGVVNVLSKGRTQSFEVDRVFDPSASQGEIFNEVQALVTSCIDGYNVCIFAYGQTGSGKTHTMEGTDSQPGINQRALQELFRETSERSTEWSYEIKVSMVEIYNETLRDLLNPDVSVKLEVKMIGNGLHIPGLKSAVVNSVADVNRVFASGRKNRATATTNMNERSSRSHALLMIYISGVSKTTKTVTSGKLNLVDLAGSERVSKSGADGARLKEAQSINKSLSCIGDVIHALRTKQSHIPYRNSKLTYLLQDSLGGDSKTLMITQVSPVEKNVSETLATLGFAQRVRAVELGQASKRVDNLVENAASEDGRVTRSRTPKK